MLHLVKESGDNLQVLNPIEPRGFKWPNLLDHQCLLPTSTSSHSAVELGVTIVDQSVTPLLPLRHLQLHFICFLFHLQKVLQHFYGFCLRFEQLVFEVYDTNGV